LAQQSSQFLGVLFIVMRQPFHVLLHHGDAHGDVELV
jgi:hypothetical protein